MDYPLAKIFERAHFDFIQLDREIETLERQYSKQKDLRITKRMFEIVPRRTESGVITLISGMAWLEKTLYAYAISYIDTDSYEEHFGTTRVLTRWLLVPRICQNKIVDEHCPIINDLREFIKARNAVIHQKSQVMYEPSVAHRKVDKEAKRFLGACRKAKDTVLGLRQLLLTKVDEGKKTDR